MNDDPWAPAAPIPGGSPWPPLVPAYMPAADEEADDSEEEVEAAETDAEADSAEPAPETQSPLGTSGAGSPDDGWRPGVEPFRGTPWQLAVPEPSAAADPEPPTSGGADLPEPESSGPRPAIGPELPIGAEFSGPHPAIGPELPTGAEISGPRPAIGPELPTGAEFSGPHPAIGPDAPEPESSGPRPAIGPEPDVAVSSGSRPAIGPEPDVAAELASIFDGSAWPTVSPAPEPEPQPGPAPVADPESAESEAAWPDPDPASLVSGSAGPDEAEPIEPEAAWPDPDPASLVSGSAGPDEAEPAEPDAASLVAEPTSVADVEAEPAPAVSEAASPETETEPVEPEAAWLAEMRSGADVEAEPEPEAASPEAEPVEPEPEPESEAASPEPEAEPVEPEDEWLAAMRSNADDELEAAWLAELSRVVDLEPDPDAEPDPESVPAAEAQADADAESQAEDVAEPESFPVAEPVAEADPAPEPEPEAEAAEPGQTLWHGRFDGGPADELLAFTVSLPFDQRLAQDDLAGSGAHVAGLAHAGLLTDDEAAAVFAALDQVEQELAKGVFTFAPSDEDIHTAVERRVTELAGDAGAKLHTGRSRNDQVATALRLWCKRELPAVAERVVALQRVLLNRAKEAGDTYLPGYTHLQRAQPVLLAHHLLAHGWALARDVDRIDDCVRRLDVSPLGAGALAGSSLPLDPEFTAEQLGFAKPFDNSLDVVGDRDFVAEALFALSLLAVHLSRMGEEIVLWTTDEFGFARLDDAYATGSSMLPQKKNADIAELARGKAGRAIGNLTGLLATLKGLPLAYNRDLQEDKEPLFDSVDQVSLALGAMAGLYRTLTFDARPMQEAADSPYMAATDLAEWLVRQGTPFRSAHAIVGELVRRALERSTPLVDLVALHPDLGPEAAALIGPGIAVSRRTTRGGGGPEAVKAQLERFEQHLKSD